MVNKRGDTLVEVMLAIGIFSMVAVSVVAVMNAGTTSSQTALETTLASQEINAQKEALQFIEKAYEQDTNVGIQSIYGDLWTRIANLAVNSDGFGGGTPINASVTAYHPSTCQELYEKDGVAQKYGFILDTRNLAAYETRYRLNKENKLGTSQIIDNIVITSQKNVDEDGLSKTLRTATTYPHLIYSTTSAGENITSDTESLIDNEATALNNALNSNAHLYGAEGIYIIAVRDPNTTAIGDATSLVSAYLDFYIRTCWYGPGDQTPFTLSTVIRIADPDHVSNIH